MHVLRVLRDVKKKGPGGCLRKTTVFDKKSMWKGDFSGGLNETKVLYRCSKSEFSHFEKNEKMNAKGMPK